MTSHTPKPPFKGLLLDVYGVLEYKGEPCPGALEFIQEINRRKVPYRLLTNSTLQSRQSMADKLQAYGFEVSPDKVVTASSASAGYLRSQNAKSIRIIIDGKGTDEFAGLPIDEENPEWLVLGDARDGFNFRNINIMYRQLLAGSKLLVMIPNVTSKEKDGPEITVGGYGKMLELAIGKPAVWIGKPSPTMFEVAMGEMGLSKEQVLMTGDNVHIDVDGAKNAGVATRQMLNGEFQDKRPGPDDNPDYVFENILDILKLL